MVGSTHAAVTPAGIRDGDPAALAALVERRANAVLAYCETVLGPQGAERAAAEAFARFRAAVATAADPRALDPETLLLSATRHAAAALTPDPDQQAGGSGLRRLLHAGRGVAPATCTQIPGLLAGRAEGALNEADRDRLARHLDRHAPCAALAERAARAEQTYAAPPDRTVPTGALTEILLALAAAAPILAVPDDGFDFGIDLDDLPPASHRDGTADAPDASTPTQTPPAATDLPAETAAGFGHEEAELEAFHDDDPPTGVAAQPADLTVQDPLGPVSEDHGSGAQTELLPVVEPEPGRGIAHPRPPRRHLDHPAAPPAHGLLYRYLLPGAFVAATLLIVMVIAGVFSSDPAPTVATTSTTQPAAPPPGAPPVSSVPSKTTRTPAEDAAVRRAATAARKAREAKAAAAREKARGEAPANGGSTATTGQAPPAVVPPASGKTTGSSSGAGRTPAKPSTGTAEQQPGQSTSALPGAESSAPDKKSPGVFEGTTP